MQLSQPKTLLTILLLGIIVTSCKYYVDHNFRQIYEIHNNDIHFDTTASEYFKVHFKNGDVSIMDNWHLNENKDSIIGAGRLYNFNRNQIKDGELSFGMNTIAIVETNQLETIKSKDGKMIAGLTILTGANIALDIYCIANPKACFGSCPTFYIEGDQGIHSSRAEGFSSAISPALEKGDIDALNHRTSVRDFRLTMKNEALETHVVNQLKLLAVTKKQDEKVFSRSKG